MVRVLPDEPAIDKTFDYLVPDGVGDQVRVGDRVRIALGGRRVGGWVVAVDVSPPAGVALRPLAKWSGRGPTPDLLELASWAAWRWAGRPASLLRTASPERNVMSLPRPPSRSRPRPDLIVGELVEGVVRLPPAADVYPVVAAAAGRGNALVLCPTAPQARAIGLRLRRDGVPAALHPQDWALGAAGATVVGTRAAAWAPVGGLAAVVVVDEHDESHQQEQAPTWHARDVAIERARRAGVPCVLTSPCPSLEALGWAGGRLSTPSRPDERDGWPIVDVVDMRREDPRTGLLPPVLVRLLRSDRRVLCVLNRTGRARLLACAACGELARCERCEAAVGQPGEPGDQLACARCGTTRPVICANCGATKLRTVRQGVTRVRDEIAALVGEPVDEVTGVRPPSGGLGTRVVVGTEATLHQLDRADVVAFLDLDQELLAPRYRAAEQALGLLARAARLVGPRSGGGRLVLQTHLPRHEVVQAALHGDPSRVAEAEAERRELLRFPPVTAMAEVSGAAAADFVAALGSQPDSLLPPPPGSLLDPVPGSLPDSLPGSLLDPPPDSSGPSQDSLPDSMLGSPPESHRGSPLGVEILGPSDGRWLVRANDHATLCDALAAVRRPPGRLRIAVDPPRI